MECTHPPEAHRDRSDGTAFCTQCRSVIGPRQIAESRPGRSAEARRKILDVATAIRHEPFRYKQDEFASITRTAWLAWGAPTQWFPDARSPICDTAFCIAGWNHAIHHPEGEALQIGYDMMDDRMAVQWSLAQSLMAAELAEDFELSEDDASLLIFGGWRPTFGVTVPEALEMLAHTAASVRDITNETAYYEWQDK